jgi:hypothetical protein
VGVCVGVWGGVGVGARVWVCVCVSVSNLRRNTSMQVYTGNLCKCG